MEESKAKGLSDYLLASILYLLINFIVFHGGIYRYLCKPDSYAGYVYGRLQLLKEIERQNNRKVIVLIGDSIPEEGIDASQFSREIGKPVANLALPGTSPYDWFSFLRSVDPDRDRFESIILTVIPQTVRTQAHNDGIQTLLPVAKIPLMFDYLSSRRNLWRNRGDYYGAVDRIFAFRRDLREMLLDPERWHGYTAAKNKQKERIRNYKGQTFDVCSVQVNPGPGKITGWGEIRDEEIKRLIRHNVNRISKLNRNPEVTGMIGQLKTIAELYKYSDTRIIVVSVPFGPGHSIATESHPIEKYLKNLEALSDQFQVEHWTAFEEPFFHDCSNFFDYRHLNHKGRPIFTQWLSQKWLQKSGRKNAF